jgi:hypothetical protein
MGRWHSTGGCLHVILYINLDIHFYHFCVHIFDHGLVLCSPEL